ncbi:MAG: RNA chaperone Hfq [Nitrospira sp.]|nr:RNA chaperone Hfq [Nitrospira sp.]
MNKDRKLQDVFLNTLRKEKVPVTVFLVNGARIKGTIKGFDNFVIMLQQSTQQLVYKHAVSTIVPDRNIAMKTEETEEPVSE